MTNSGGLHPAGVANRASIPRSRGNSSTTKTRIFSLRRGLDLNNTGSTRPRRWPAPRCSIRVPIVDWALRIYYCRFGPLLVAGVELDSITLNILEAQSSILNPQLAVLNACPTSALVRFVMDILDRSD